MDYVCHDAELKVVDLELSSEFRSRPPQKRSTQVQLRTLRRMVRGFAMCPGKTLQAIADAALDLCKADSAGVSVDTQDANGMPVLYWAATSGKYARLREAMLPKFQMPCSISLETMRPQHIRVPSAHFTALGVAAEAITDGISIPWSVNGMRGTVWIFAHQRSAAFNSTDYQILQSFADFAMATARDQRQQELIVERATAARREADNVSHLLSAGSHSSPEKTYLFRLKVPQPSMRFFVAASFEVHDDQLVLLDSRGDLVALLVREIIESWCELDMRPQSSLIWEDRGDRRKHR